MVVGLDATLWPADHQQTMPSEPVGLTVIRRYKREFAAKIFHADCTYRDGRAWWLGCNSEVGIREKKYRVEMDAIKVTSSPKALGRETLPAARLILTVRRSVQRSRLLGLQVASVAGRHNLALWTSIFSCGLRMCTTGCLRVRRADYATSQPKNTSCSHPALPLLPLLNLLV